MPHLSCPSPLGDITLFEEDGALVALDWGRAPDGRETALLLKARDQIEAYFAAELDHFDLPLDPGGSPHLRKVLGAVREIPYGQTRSYGEIARQIHSAPRAVGGACGRNPLPILIPCHRVLASQGGLGGYSGLDGVLTKKFLLALESGRDSASFSAQGTPQE